VIQRAGKNGEGNGEVEEEHGVFTNHGLYQNTPLVE
jgi:hypothetical protein